MRKFILVALFLVGCGDGGEGVDEDVLREVYTEDVCERARAEFVRCSPPTAGCAPLADVGQCLTMRGCDLDTTCTEPQRPCTDTCSADDDDCMAQCELDREWDKANCRISRCWTAQGIKLVDE
jgi:hypothetical protein